MPYTGYGIVRDKNGKPRFDDIKNIHPQHWAMLTQAEKNTIKAEQKLLKNQGE